MVLALPLIIFTASYRQRLAQVPMGHWERGKGVKNALPCNRHSTRILEPFDKLLNVPNDPDDVRYSLPNEVYE